jgi:hypothetical protein
MDKYTALKNIFVLENISEKIACCPKITEKLLLEVIAKDSYNLKNDLGITHTTVSRYIKKLFPDKPSTSAKVCNYLLYKYGYKHCKKCNIVKETNYFYNNNACNDGLSSYCKQCQADLEKPTASARTAKYRAAKLLRSPNWISEDEKVAISNFYKNCPKGYQVDHIIPLQGENVSGLHVLNNLQYLTPEANSSKKNKFMPL